MIQLKNKCVKIAICTLFLLINAFMLSGCMSTMSHDAALETIYNSIGIDIPADSATMISNYYNTNVREEGYLIVVDVNDLDIYETVQRLKLIPFNLSEAVENGMSKELVSILVKYYEDSQVLYCRYEYNHLLNGKEHPASVYLITLSEAGRLLLYVDI